MNFTGLLKKISMQKTSINLKKSDVSYILEGIEQSITQNNYKNLEIIRKIKRKDNFQRKIRF